MGKKKPIEVEKVQVEIEVEVKEVAEETVEETKRSRPRHVYGVDEHYDPTHKNTRAQMKTWKKPEYDGD